jgi:hypothetical protein
VGIVKYFIFLQAIHSTPQYIVGWELLSTSYFYKLYIIDLNILLGGDCKVLHISTSYTFYASIYCWTGIVKYFIFLQAIHYTPQYIVGWGLLSTSYFYKLYIMHLNILLGGDWKVLHISTSYTLYTSIYCWMGIVKYVIFLQAIHYAPQYIVGWGLLSTSYF